MKTHTLLIKASTQSEWDSVEFFATEIDINYLKKMDEKAKEIKAIDSSFAHISLYHGGSFFCSDEDGLTPLEENDTESGIFEFNEETYPHPEQRIDGLQIKFDGDGWFAFVAYGKHTSEEFWTDSVSIAQIEEKLTQIAE